jgi:hypothetical protein
MIARDYEKPVDIHKDNVYKVTIIATDGDKNTTSKDLGVLEFLFWCPEALRPHW